MKYQIDEMLDEVKEKFMKEGPKDYVDTFYTAEDELKTADDYINELSGWDMGYGEGDSYAFYLLGKIDMLEQLKFTQELQ